MIVFPPASFAVALTFAVPPATTADGETDNTTLATIPLTTTASVNGVPNTTACVANPLPNAFPPPFAAS